MSKDQLATAEVLGQGYSAVDIIGIIFKVTKSFKEDLMPEGLKLAFIREIGV